MEGQVERRERVVANCIRNYDCYCGGVRSSLSNLSQLWNLAVAINDDSDALSAALSSEFGKQFCNNKTVSQQKCVEDGNF